MFGSESVGCCLGEFKEQLSQDALGLFQLDGDVVDMVERLIHG